MASTMGFSLLFALILVTAVAARQAPLGDEKAYAPPYGSDPTPSGASPVVPTPTTPADPTPVTPTDPVPSTPTTPTTPNTPSPTPPTPTTPTPTTPSEPAPVTPADPVPTTPTTPYTPVPAPVVPADPVTPTTPYTPDPTVTPIDPIPATPAASTPGTCTWWSAHTSSFPDIVSIFSTIIDLFGTITGGSGSSGTGVTSTIASIFGGQLTVVQSLTNTRTDGFGALARQGSAALLNSLTRRDYPYNAFQVKTQFRKLTSKPATSLRNCEVVRECEHCPRSRTPLGDLSLCLKRSFCTAMVIVVWLGSFASAYFCIINCFVIRL